MHLFDQRFEAFGILREAPAMVAGELVFAVGDKGALVQRQAACRQVMRKLHQVVERIALDIELAAGPVLHHGGNLVHVVTADVTLIRARVHRDALGAGLQAQAGRLDYIGDAEMAGIAKQRDLVDIDGQGRPGAGMVGVLVCGHGFYRGWVKHCLKSLQVPHHLPGFQDLHIAMVVQQDPQLGFKFGKAVDTGMHGV